MANKKIYVYYFYTFVIYGQAFAVKKLYFILLIIKYVRIFAK